MRKELAGSELIAQMNTEARRQLPGDIKRVVSALKSWEELLARKRKPSDMQLDKSQTELAQAQERLAGSANTVTFFISLDESSHFGDAEPVE